MAYNSLVTLRQRVRQGWSNIDVQLKRRNDLIPNLVALVLSLAGHERETQEACAALRAQLSVTPPGRPGPDVAPLAGRVIALAERYPTLTAQSGYAHLMRELGDTEERIALARAYFNDIATEWNTRLQRIPDRFVAALGAMKPQPLL